jgi:hypothetical protein
VGLISRFPLFHVPQQGIHQTNTNSPRPQDGTEGVIWTHWQGFQGIFMRPMCCAVHTNFLAY